MRHCLLVGLASITPEQEERCRQELDHTLTACSREQPGIASCALQGSSLGFGSDPIQKRAIARTAFVACLDD